MHLLLLVRHLLLLAMHLFREISLLFNFRFFIRFKAGSFMINGRLQRRFTVATTYSATAVALHGETPREVATSRKETSRNKCLAASNKCLTSSNKKLVETSDTVGKNPHAPERGSRSSATNCVAWYGCRFRLGSHEHQVSTPGFWDGICRQTCPIHRNKVVKQDETLKMQSYIAYWTEFASFAGFRTTNATMLRTDCERYRRGQGS